MAGGRSENEGNSSVDATLHRCSGIIESIAPACCRESSTGKEKEVSSVKNRLYGFIAGLCAGSQKSNEKSREKKSYGHAHGS